jgi:phage baseplate assembly protein W
MTIKQYPQDADQFNGTIGLKFPLNGKKGRTFFNASRTTEEQALTNYINLLLTRRGERYYHPDFGIGIQDYLFEQNTSLVRQDMEFQIKRQADYWLPYIINHKIEVKERADLPGLNAAAEQAIQVVITFSVGNSNANKTITLFQRGGQVITNITE